MPYQRFTTADGYMVIGAGNQHLWEWMAHAPGHSEWLEDDRFRTMEARVDHRPELERLIEEVLGKELTSHWVEVLDRAGVPCGPVNSYDQVFSDPQVRHRKMMMEYDDPQWGPTKMLRTPVRLSEGGIALRRPAPALGQHTREILAEIGLSDREIDDLAAKGAI